MKKKCSDCNSSLSRDEYGLNKKLFPGYEDAGILMCFSCMAEYLELTVDDLKYKVKQFKEQGCTLFK